MEHVKHNDHTQMKGSNEHGDHEGHNNHEGHHEIMMKDFKKRFFISLIISIPVLILSPLIQSFLNFSIHFTYDLLVLFILSVIIYFYGGWPFLSGMVKEIGNKRPGMMTLIAVAITVAFIYSGAVVFGLKGRPFFWELATLIDIMLLGHWIEMRSVLGASNALSKLAKLLPDTAHKVQKNQIEEVKVGQIKKDDILLVKPGEKIPVDGNIIEGSSYVDQSMLTGEFKPVKKEKDDKVIGGSINKEGSFRYKVTEAENESYLSKVINLVSEAQKSKSKTQNLADKAAFWLVIISLTVGLVTFISWIIILNDLPFAIERMATVMIITCPHALGLAIPLVVAISTSYSAKNGLLIRNRTAFEASRKITTVVFDKTGTLTEGNFGVISIYAFSSKYKEKTILQYAASVEQESEHPIAQGVVDRAKENNVDLKKVNNFQVFKGKGVEGIIDGQNIKVVSPNYLEKNNLQRSDEIEKANISTVVYVLINDEVTGAISLGDSIREVSYEAIKKLKEHGIKSWMLTGDNKKTAQSVSQKLGLDGFFAEVLPEQKQEKINKLKEENEVVAMVGDGINDAPALAAADIGIAIGSGTDIAVEAADIILVNNNPKDIHSLILFGKLTYNKMIQNLFWAAGYNIIAIPLSAGILYSYGIVISPAIAAIVMSLSTVIVALNSRLLKFPSGY